MQRIDYSTRERLYTQAGPMDLNVERLVWGDAVRGFAVGAGGWGVGLLGFLLVIIAPYGYDGDGWILTALRVFVGAFGAGITLIAWTVAGAAVWCLVGGWFAYRDRLDDWHRAQLGAYNKADGQVVDRALSVKALTIQEPAHLLLVALALAERAQREEGLQPSVSVLTGDLWIGTIKVGELSKPAAEEFLAALAQIGLIKGRTKGKAGTLATLDTDEVKRLVSTKAGRVKQIIEHAEPKGAE